MSLGRRSVSSGFMRILRDVRRHAMRSLSDRPARRQRHRKNHEDKKNSKQTHCDKSKSCLRGITSSHRLKN